ncbi:MAG: AAA family ATPase [Calothrix sp. MO_192.B10]|nr:AAA family ATPase [Calothrix sp. MO_192.B10]
MPNKLNHLQIKNFRSLVDVSMKVGSLNVLFGPNGAGKSTFLDTIWFLRDCAIRGVDSASSYRDHGIGILWYGVKESENIAIIIEDNFTRYEVLFGFSSGRIEPFVGEKLVIKDNINVLIDRKVGSDKATFYNIDTKTESAINLREPEKLALTSYVGLQNSDSVAIELDNLLRSLRFYHFRNVPLYNLRRYGSEVDSGDRLQDRCENLWSVLRNLHDRRMVDERYDTIINFMKETFPYFKGLFFEQTSRNIVYANFLDTRPRRKPIQASGVSDGHLQMLINLTALFSERPNSYSLVLLDEPEISLHPWALAMFAKAVKLATEKWNKQVFIATHSPVLLSQFEPENIWAAELDVDGKTVMKRVSDIPDIQDLLEDYATGSLYMAQAIAPQSKESI